jgi:hypothetical protein
VPVVCLAEGIGSLAIVPARTSAEHLKLEANDLASYHYHHPHPERRMADVFRVQEGTTNGSPIASTSHSTLDVVEANGAGPSLAQLLQETVREGARRGSRTSSTRSRNGASKIDSHAPLPSLPSISSPASRAYISSLLSKDLTALLKEPEELSRQSEVLDGDLATLCYKSIGELLGVGECVDSVEDGFE